ncbi:GTP-binding protein Di-Ras3 [Molossus molossus]|uniref:DIRAS family GTPase 3 n=1 Tax=Molossus molossus TaxID=27622 RepID=A0A7J8F768_MOLMO|nr:GTP-binding protein Di-Ras3 [Molossus molossus]KAF6443486.1 DIRAS family GTPase 3 [Molossus molossus]
MGNSCFGLKEKLMQRLRPLPTLLIIRTVMPQRKNKDFCVVILGSAGVGKSALVKRWVRGNFREKYVPTVEDTYHQMPGSSRGTGTLHVTDTAGGHRYRGLQRLAIARGHAFVLVYSVTKKQTLEELKPFYELIREIKGRNVRKYPIVLVGNKCDDSRRRELTSRDGAAYALEWNCAFMETSAKTDVNVQELFQVLLNHAKKPATNPQPLQKKSQVPKIAEKLLGKCIIM